MWWLKKLFFIRVHVKLKANVLSMDFVCEGISGYYYRDSCQDDATCN